MSEIVDGCDLCMRYEGDLHYRRHDLSYYARRLTRTGGSQAALERVRAAKASLAEVRRMYDEHKATDHAPEGGAA